MREVAAGLPVGPGLVVVVDIGPAAITGLLIDQGICASIQVPRSECEEARAETIGDESYFIGYDGLCVK